MKIERDRRTRPDDRSLIRRSGRSRRSSRSAISTHWLLRAARRGAILAALVLAAASAVAAQPALPGPLEGPGHPELKRRDAKRLAKAVAKLEDNDLAAASAAATKAGDTPARELLELQIAIAAAEPPVPELEQLCARHPDYAAAWVTLSEAAALSGLESTALEAARRSAELWPESTWARRAGELERRYVDGRITQAQALTAEGQTEAALEMVDAALLLAPSDRTALLTRADLLSALGRTGDAEAILRNLGDDPEVLVRRARLAESQHDLAAAMALWGALPVDVAGRDESLRRVQLEWRRQNLPEQVQAALADESLDRAGLAAVLVGLVPEAHAIGGGQVPVLSDIVGLEAQREILTVVRIGVMQADLLEHRFYPRRTVEPSEARRAVDKLCSLLDRNSPEWCAEGAPVTVDCTALTSPVSGAAVANAVLRTAPLEVP